MLLASLEDGAATKGLGMPTLLNEIQQNIIRTHIDMHNFIRRKSLGEDEQAKRILETIIATNKRIDYLADYLKSQKIIIPTFKGVIELPKPEKRDAT